MTTSALLNNLNNLSYPPSMAPIQGIPGKAFFPGGRGVWRAGDTDIAGKKYMVLGQDFDTLEAFERAKAAGSEDVQKNATWRNLLVFLDACGIAYDDCFFTNVIMGARREGSNSGRSPAFKDKAFIEACREFFLMQVKAQKPVLILVLGKEPARFLSALSDHLKEWKQEQTFSQMDSAKEQVKQDVVFENGITSNLVVLTHPSFRLSNVHRRCFGNEKGHSAEVAMINSLK